MYRKSQRGYISPFLGEVPIKPNTMKIGNWVGVTDIINHTKFGDYQSRDYEIMEGQILPCSMGMAYCL